MFFPEKYKNERQKMAESETSCSVKGDNDFLSPQDENSIKLNSNPCLPLKKHLYLQVIRIVQVTNTVWLMENRTGLPQIPLGS